MRNADIFDSNRPMLKALIQEAGFEPIDGGCVSDDPAAIADSLRRLSRQCDMIVCSGGASVGDKDFCAAAVCAAGGHAIPLKIAMKPGKPAVVGAIDSTPLLGLPGNPVAALVSWILLGLTMAGKLAGRSPARTAPLYLTNLTSVAHKPGRTSFLPARLVSGRCSTAVEIFNGGGSARLTPLIACDGLVEIPAQTEEVLPGDYVSFQPWRNLLILND